MLEGKSTASGDALGCGVCYGPAPSAYFPSQADIWPLGALPWPKPTVPPLRVWPRQCLSDRYFGRNRSRQRIQPLGFLPHSLLALNRHRPPLRFLSFLVDLLGSRLLLAASIWASRATLKALPLAVMGGIDPDSGGLTSSRWSNRSWGRRLSSFCEEAIAPSGCKERLPQCGVALFLVGPTISR